MPSDGQILQSSRMHTVARLAGAKSRATAPIVFDCEVSS